LIHALHEPREVIVEELSELGVRVNEILLCGPTYSQLKGMRDGLRVLHDAIKARPIPQRGMHFTSRASFSQAIREEMK
jgi:hypothetical protein